MACDADGTALVAGVSGWSAGSDSNSGRDAWMIAMPAEFESDPLAHARPLAAVAVAADG
jgi:hypothetical protein